MTLSEKAVSNLKNYVYAREGKSLLESFMNSFWEGCIGFVPKSIAPNMITLIGLAINILPTIIVIFYARLGQDLPSLVYALSGVSIFVYQTLDAIDGKQARRLDMSSPLGELFDHGCDSISTFLLIILASSACNSLNSPWLHYAVLFGMLSFYLTQWYTYVTGKLFFTIINVTESQLAAVVLCFTTFFFGTEIYEFEIYDVTFSSWILYFIITSFIFMCVNMIIRLTSKILQQTSDLTVRQCVRPAIPCTIILLFGFYCVLFCRTVVEVDRFAFLIIFSSSFSLITLKLLAAKTTKTTITVINSSLIFPAVYILNIWLGILYLDWFPLLLAVLSIAVWILEFGIVCIDFSLILNIPVLFL